MPFWLLLFMFFSWCLGIWVSGNCSSRCSFLFRVGFPFLGSFCPVNILGINSQLGCELPDKECFWDSVRCGYRDFWIECTSFYWELILESELEVRRQGVWAVPKGSLVLPGFSWSSRNWGREEEKTTVDSLIRDGNKTGIGFGGKEGEWRSEDLLFLVSWGDMASRLYYT